MKSDARFRASYYNLRVSNSPRTLLFNGVTGALLKLDRKLARALTPWLGEERPRTAGTGYAAWEAREFRVAELPASIRDRFPALLDAGVFVPCDADEREGLRRAYVENRAVAPFFVTITTTLDCNMRCYYCYQKEGELEDNVARDGRRRRLLDRARDRRTRPSQRASRLVRRRADAQPGCDRAHFGAHHPVLRGARRRLQGLDDLQRHELAGRQARLREAQSSRQHPILARRTGAPPEQAPQHGGRGRPQALVQRGDGDDRRAGRTHPHLPAHQRRSVGRLERARSARRMREARLALRPTRSSIRIWRSSTR